MSIKVSIIIPVYNTSVYLKECVESLINQTLKEIELIFVNDGSTDDSLEILKSYAKTDDRIVIINQQNCGQSCARNAGLKAAKGEFIGFIDSDDWAMLDMFEKLYANANSYNSEISICSIAMHNEKTNKFYYNDSYMSLDIFGDEFNDRCFSPEETFDFIFKISVTPWNKIYQRELLLNNDVKFIENLNFEDNVFFIDAYTSASRISLVNEPLICYRQFSQTSYSYAVKKHDKKRLDFFKILELQEDILKKKNLYATLKEQFLWHRENTLNYWHNKLEDKDIKKEFRTKIQLLYPELYMLKPYRFISDIMVVFKLNCFLKHNKIVFWGASIFLGEFLTKFKIKNKNIIGIIDKDESKQNTFFCGYNIYAPSKLKELECEFVVPSVVNLFNFDMYLKRQLKKINPALKTKSFFGQREIFKLKD